MPISQCCVIYEFRCPGCCDSYIGKTDRNFRTRVNEHGTYRYEQTTAVYTHLMSCQSFQDMVRFLNIGYGDETNGINIPSHILEAARENTEILARNDDWVQLCFLETLFFKRMSPALNDGLKAMKAFKLFT